AYNGGIGLAAKQLPHAEEELDVWVETIPGEETRRYGKRGIPNHGSYRFLYDRQAPFPDLPDTGRSRRRHCRAKRRAHVARTSLSEASRRPHTAGWHAHSPGSSDRCLASLLYWRESELQSWEMSA